MITQIDGWWWPEADRKARPILTRMLETEIAAVLEHIPGRTCIVQAGGNVGLYPLALADHFRRVMTFEPDPVNVECLWKNVAARDSLRRVDARCAALGATENTCGMVAVAPDNCGAHRIEPGAGNIPVLAIDGLGLIVCDAIWLDIEGFEFSALLGARATLEKWSPTVIIEDKGLGRAFGQVDGEAAGFLESQGYHQVGVSGRDKIFRKTP